MQEIEVKILDIDEEKIINQLVTLGAKKIFEGEIHALAFDFPDKRLDNEDSFVRVRTVGDKVELCFKGEKKDSQFKSREEIEVSVSGFKDTIQILEKIGLKKYHEGKKHRQSYKFEDARFEIDSWENIPPFLEIEAKTEEKVKEFVERLGYTMDQTSNWGYLTIEEHYKNKQEKLNNNQEAI